MQLAVIEYCRNVLGIKNASSSEFDNKNHTYVVDLMKEWKKNNGNKEKRSKKSNLGGTQRLGTYDAEIKKDTLAYKLYGSDRIKERHRHRYEVDIKYKDELEKNGMIMSGLSPDGKLPEIIELKDHVFFIASQFHPEFNSNPFKPNPLFKGFIEEALNQK